MELQRGMRDRLERYVDVNRPIEAELQVSGTSVYDFCCFGVDGNNKLSDDRYMVFYNQTASPANEIAYRDDNGSAVFTIYLNRIPMTIQKLVFTVSIDGSGVMRNINSHVFTLKQNGISALRLALNGSDFQQERAIISVEIYMKDVWRINAVARGFNGGLGDLLRAYGGVEAAPESQILSPRIVAPTVLQLAKISLEKKLEKAPQLVSLAKPLTLELERRNLLGIVAKVALVMDISGSMDERYSDGTVQQIVNKILPLAVQFDDDGELDFWYYGSRSKRMESINLDNYTAAVPNNWKELMGSLGFGTNAADVIEEVSVEYDRTRIPAYIIFVTDGAFPSPRKVKKILSKVSNKPIFWQFVGIGGGYYGILRKLDTMKGRYVDNANFFALDDFRKVSNSELYSRLLNEFPKWLDEIKRNGML